MFEKVFTKLGKENLKDDYARVKNVIVKKSDLGEQYEKACKPFRK